MSNEDKLWRSINAIATRLNEDHEFEASFTKNAGAAIADAGLDVAVPATTTSEEVKLSALFDRLNDLERRATIDAVIGSRFDPGRVAAVTPVANANVGANANALANANANANANTNTNGFSAGGIRGDLIHVELGQKFRGSDLADSFAKFRLSPARQAALVKSLFSDSNAVVSREPAGQGELQKAVGSFRGISFEIEALVLPGEIAVQNAALIR